MNIIPKTAYLNTPIGWLSISGTDDGVESVMFIHQLSDIRSCCPGINSFMNVSSGRDTIEKSGLNHVVRDCIVQLDEYFSGKRRQFDLPLNPKGSEFRKRVWSEVAKVGYGETSTYQKIANALGDSNGKNPIPIIIPCHRIIGSDGKLTGYAGGLERKKWLLDFEQVQYGLF